MNIGDLGKCPAFTIDEADKLFSRKSTRKNKRLLMRAELYLPPTDDWCFVAVELKVGVILAFESDWVKLSSPVSSSDLLRSLETQYTSCLTMKDCPISF